MNTRTIETCPVPQRGIALLDHSFDHVAQAFASFKSAKERGRYEQRGGFTREGRNPRIPSGNQDAVESSFTPDQLAYVGLCVAGLNKLTRGETFLHQTVVLPTLSEEIQLRFLDNPPTRLCFGLSVAESTVSLFYRFRSLYPNLLPALEATTRAAGTEGTLEAIVGTQDLLHNALQGETAIEEDTYLAPTATVYKFTAQHLTEDLRGKYEIWCNGEAFGKSIIRQAKTAALQLATTPGVRDKYDFLDDWYDPDVTREQIRQSVAY